MGIIVALELWVLLLGFNTWVLNLIPWGIIKPSPEGVMDLVVADYVARTNTPADMFAIY